jgi:hypothetical protein
VVDTMSCTQPMTPTAVPMESAATKTRRTAGIPDPEYAIKGTT